jgi:hypothetical protein
MATSMVLSTAAWLAAGTAAGLLALAMPDEGTLMGQLPHFKARRLDQQPVALPQELPSDRTLALVVFGRGQREEAQSWVQGLGLAPGGAIPWLKVAVLDDPGDEPRREAIERAMRDRHANPADRARLVPLFTDRQAFVRAARLSGTDHASVLVLDRAGRVLARAEGAFDEIKAQALLETLLPQATGE